MTKNGSMFDIKAAFIAAIERTQNPLAPIIFDETYKYVNRLGEMMSRMGSKKKAETHLDNLMACYPEDMNDISKEPEYIVALCILLSESLVSYGKELGKAPVTK